MPNAPVEPTAADKQIDAAIAKVAAPEMARIGINLPSGRQAFVEFPMPLSPDEALRISGAFITAYLQAFDAEQRHSVGHGRIIIPGA